MIPICTVWLPLIVIQIIVIATTMATAFLPIRAAVSTPAGSVTTTPVIGILSQPIGINGTEHYIAASYVKWLEAGGARSIPVPYDADEALVDDLFQQMNGFLLPGGSAEISPAVYHLLDKAVQSNDQGKYFPVWGTCLGFEFLIRYMGGPTAIEAGYDAYNISLPLYHVQRWGLYREDDVYRTVTKRNVTMNNHHQAISPGHFANHMNLTARWRATSINWDSQGKPFVSTIEPRNPELFPIYGVQYHPEKNAFEYATYPGTDTPYEAIDHSLEAVKFSMYIAECFVALAAKAKAENKDHEYNKADLYPYIFTYPIRTGLKFEQVYIIPNASHWTNPNMMMQQESYRRNLTTLQISE